MHTKKELLQKLGMSEDEAENFLVRTEEESKIPKPYYPVPKRICPTYEDNLLDWVNEYISVRETPSVEYSLFTSGDNLKKMIESDFDKRCNIIDHTISYCIDDNILLFIKIGFSNFRHLNKKPYVIQFSFSSQSPNVLICGVPPFDSYFPDVDAIKVNKFLKDNNLITVDFDWEFEIEKTWEEALELFKILFIN